MDNPQIIAHYEQSVNFSLFDCRWIPCSAKFIVLGSRPKGTGLMQIYEISNGSTSLIKECEKPKSFRCGTFGASSFTERHLATGDFDGRLHIWNLENLDIPVYSVNAHNEIINCIDGVGGLHFNCGAPEIVTGSRDGSVKVWDPRQKNKPVAVMEPPPGESKRDCWTVCFGNSYNNSERMVVAGYDNGDLKLYDLRSMSLKWEANIKNGVCGLEFDRRDIQMNKLVATTLESRFYVYDMRTFNEKSGYSYLSEKAHKSTIWTCKHLPQNRDIFITCGGGGSLCLWKYNYPEKRVKEDGDGNSIGVAGSLTLLQNSTLSSQPISSFDWSPDKQGLAVCTSFDQMIRLLIVTKLNRF